MLLYLARRPLRGAALVFDQKERARSSGNRCDRARSRRDVKSVNKSGPRSTQNTAKEGRRHHAAGTGHGIIQSGRGTGMLAVHRPQDRGR